MILRDVDGSLLPFAKGSSRVNFPRILPSIVDFLVFFIVPNSLSRSDENSANLSSQWWKEYRETL